MNRIARMMCAAFVMTLLMLASAQSPLPDFLHEMETRSAARQWQLEVLMWSSETTNLITDIYRLSGSVQGSGGGVPTLMPDVEALYDRGREILNQRQNHLLDLQELDTTNPESVALRGVLSIDNAAATTLLRGLDFLRAYHGGVSGTELELRIQIFDLSGSVFQLWRHK